MRRPRLKRTTETFTAPSGDLHLVRPGVGAELVVEAPTEEQRELLGALDGAHPLAALEERFGAGEVGETISQLRELGAIEDAADDDLVPEAERERLDRQLRYFSDLGNGGPTPSERQARLRGAKVAVLGVGGLGSWSAMALACSGVGEMWLVDGDRVEPSNLNRQMLYTVADLGLLKVEAAQGRLRAFSPETTVTATARRLGSQAELADFVAGADLVVNTADWPAFEIERWCNVACFEAGIPFVSMSHFSRVARVGPFYVPGRTGCYACQEAAFRRGYPLFEAMAEAAGDSGEAATLGAACGLIGGQVGVEAVHFLTGLAEPATLGAAHSYDLTTMEVRREPVVPEPGCPVCSGWLAERGERLEEAAGK